MKTFPRTVSGSILLSGMLLSVGSVEEQGRRCHRQPVQRRQRTDGGGGFDYGGVTSAIEFDPTQDAKNNPASGSMKVTLGFDAAALNPTGNNKGAISIGLSPPLDGSAYLTMEMDVKIDPASAADGSGNSGYFQMVIRNAGNFDFNSQFGGNVKRQRRMAPHLRASIRCAWRHSRDHA